MSAKKQDFCETQTVREILKTTDREERVRTSLVYVCMCVCVRMRERETEKDRERLKKVSKKS